MCFQLDYLSSAEITHKPLLALIGYYAGMLKVLGKTWRTWYKTAF